MKPDRKSNQSFFARALDFIQPERISKHSFMRKFRSTKAYADDRQKAPHNRRANGLRRRRN